MFVGPAGSGTGPEGDMPWFPDFVAAVELVRRETRAAGQDDPVAQYLHALERLFQLNPDADGSDNADGEADVAQDA